MRPLGNEPGTACFRNSEPPWDSCFPEWFSPLLSAKLSNEQFFAYGWRIPFLTSAVLVLIGLYVRLTIHETPVFRDALHREKRVKVPMVTVFRDHSWGLLVGTLSSLATFVLFYLMIVFALSCGVPLWLGYPRDKFLIMQLVGIVLFAVIIISAIMAERGRRTTLLWVTFGIFVFGLIMAFTFLAGTAGRWPPWCSGPIFDGL